MRTSGRNIRQQRRAKQEQRDTQPEQWTDDDVPASEQEQETPDDDGD